MQKITLRGTHEGATVRAGVVFVDGIGEAELGPNSRRYFEATGATVEDLVGEGGKSRALSDLNIAELRTYAEKNDITVKATKKDDIIGEIQKGLTERASAESTKVQEITSEVFSDVIEAGRRVDNTVHTAPADQGNADTTAVDNTANTAGNTSTSTTRG